jgi:tetratricopeptide (TPR) repeat protein
MKKPFLLLICAAMASAQHQHQPGPAKPARLMDGYGRHHHPIATTSEEAQKFFDQGLELVFGFNHDEAVRSFARAAELDPKAAMPHWGMAFSLGPNYNLPPEPEREKAAWEALQQAQSRKAGAPQHERDYIDALAKRYSSDPKADRMQLAAGFKDAMGDLARKYPDDLDAITLYAESAMDLRPWQLYKADGTANEGTDEIVTVLESVMRRDPDHPGANHYYIHAVEASNRPERGLESARRLPALVPAAGHLVHMPSHIYARTGDWEASAVSNVQAAEADRKYIQESGTTGIYPMMYYSHNLHFIAISRAMQGREREAMEAAKQLSGNVAPGAIEMPMIAPFLAIEWQTMVRFRLWDQILRIERPDERLPVLLPFYHFSRGAALAGKRQAKEAETERALFTASSAKVPAEATVGMEPARNVMLVAAAELEARIARARGDLDAEIGHWRKAVEAQEALRYSEPPTWYYPVRESLGGALLRKGDAASAEAVFRADLQRNPRNGRSLMGLYEALTRQGKDAAASWVKLEFNSTWPKEGEKLSLDLL